MSDLSLAAGGISPYTPSLVGGTGTTAKIFPSLLGPGFGNGGNALGAAPSSTALVPPTAATGTPPALVTIPGTGQYEQQALAFVASGYVFMHGTSPTINFVLQNGTSLTAASNTTVATLASAQSLTTGAYYPWSFSMKGQGDSVSGVFQCFSAVWSCNGVFSGTVTLTDLTGINLTTTNLNFVFGVTFGVSDALAVGCCSQWKATIA